MYSARSYGLRIVWVRILLGAPIKGKNNVYYYTLCDIIYMLINEELQ
jgi:hypothetical protein